jgi:uncharacterized oxidoreductase
VLTSGNSVLVTGGATGIGFALARDLVAAGNTVAICGRRQGALAAAKKQVPELLTKVCDVARPASRQALVRWIGQRLPALNILVNNAGIQRPIDFLRGSEDLSLADDEIAINLAAPVHLIGLLLPRLLKQPVAAIVNVSSGLGFTPLAAVPVYSATKAAIHALTLSLRYQLRETSVRVFEVVPPVVPTALSGSRERNVESAHTMTPEAVAQGIMQALAEDRFEAPLGAAANLFAQRDQLFAALNR